MQALLSASWGLPGQGLSAVQWFSGCAPGSSVIGVTRELVSSTHCQAPPQTYWLHSGGGTQFGVLTSPGGESDTCNSRRTIAVSLRLMDFHQDKIRTDLIVKLPAPSLAP